MNRKSFIKKSVLGLFGLSAAQISSPHELATESTQALAPVGFNHLPPKKTYPMKTVFHPANSRGHANHGWLNSHHSFSFANYYNPERMHFGVLRVLNDDEVAPGQGFGTHPHENMEIISIPLEGNLEHKDSMGSKALIKQGDVQVMSAGTGVYHSEYNASKQEPVKFLQIWVFPKTQGVEPRYDQITLDPDKMRNQLHQVLSPDPDDEGVWIHQDAWFYLGNFEAGQQAAQALKQKGNGFYLFLLEGAIQVGDQKLNSRDALGIWETDKLEFSALSASRVLLMEVPMELPRA